MIEDEQGLRTGVGRLEPSHAVVGKTLEATRHLVARRADESAGERNVGNLGARAWRPP